MAITAVTYGKFLQKQLDGGHPVDFDTDTIKVSLHTSVYTPARDTHEFFSSITNELATALGYTAGGATLAGASVGLDTGGHFAYFDATDVTWAGAGFTFRYAVLRKDTGVAGTSPVICYFDFGTDITPAGDYILQWAIPGSGAILKFLSV